MLLGDQEAMEDTSAEDDSSIANTQPWRDKETLRHYYWRKGYTLREVGNQLGCSKPTIRDWMERCEIPVRNGTHGWSEPWDGESELRELYIDKELTIYEIAQKFDCGKSTVHDYLVEYDIPLRRTGPSRKTHPRIMTDYQGYETARSDYRGTADMVKLHRLLAVHKYGFEAVAGMVVHHKKNIPWLNTPSNIELMELGEHTKHHYENGDMSY